MESITKHAKKISRETATTTTLNAHKDAHYHDDCRRSSNNESRKDPVMSLASNETQTSMLPSVASRTHENYHLDSFHIPKKSGSGNVPHKSPGNNALVEHEPGLKKKSVQMPSRVTRSSSLNLDIFADDAMNDDVSMDDLFIKLLEGSRIGPPRRQD
jgi:hypothetical protein